MQALSSPRCMKRAVSCHTAWEAARQNRARGYVRRRAPYASSAERGFAEGGNGAEGNAVCTSLPAVAPRVSHRSGAPGRYSRSICNAIMIG